jgi:hypothetical protein
MEVIITDYLRYRAKLRGFRLNEIEEIVRYSSERYADTVTGRKVVVGKHGDVLVMIPYEIERDSMVPITIHTTTRQQVKFRIKVGRFTYE